MATTETRTIRTKTERNEDQNSTATLLWALLVIALIAAGAYGWYSYNSGSTLLVTPETSATPDSNMPADAANPATTTIINNSDTGASGSTTTTTTTPGSTTVTTNPSSAQ